MYQTMVALLLVQGHPECSSWLLDILGHGSQVAGTVLKGSEVQIFNTSISTSLTPDLIVAAKGMQSWLKFFPPLGPLFVPNGEVDVENIFWSSKLGPQQWQNPTISDLQDTHTRPPAAMV